MVSGIEINGRKTDIIGSSLYYNGVRIGSINQSTGVITLNETCFNVMSYELTPDEFDKLREKKHTENKQKQNKIKWYRKFDKRKNK